MHWEIVDLRETSKRGKQIVREHGRLAKVLRGPEPMQCFDGAEGVRVRIGEHERNVRLYRDKHFVIERIIWEPDICFAKMDNVGWCDRAKGHDGDHTWGITPAQY